jgi:hypothetical protein
MPRFKLLKSHFLGDPPRLHKKGVIVDVDVPSLAMEPLDAEAHARLAEEEAARGVRGGNYFGAPVWGGERALKLPTG